MQVKSESEVAQLCLTPSDPMDCSLPGSSVHGIFQARVLEWGDTAAVSTKTSAPATATTVPTETTTASMVASVPITVSTNETTTGFETTHHGFYHSLRNPWESVPTQASETTAAISKY